MPFDDLYGAKRQFWRILLLFVMSLQLFGLIYNYIQKDEAAVVSSQLQQHAVDATVYHKERESISSARARAAVMMINAIADGRTFTPEERQQISQLWKNADFDKIQEQFLITNKKE